MNFIVPIRDFAAEAEPQRVAGPSLGSEREIWAERRRLLERRGRHVGPEGSRPAWRGEVFGWGIRGFALAARIFGFYRQGRRNALAPQLRHVTLTFDDLPPAFDGYRILHLSDTHFDCLPELAPVARRMLAELEVDLLAVTGDVHGHHRATLAESAAPLAHMVEGVRARDGQIGILGNHDPGDMAEALERLGFEVLLNGSIVLKRDRQQIVVTGLDDVHRFYTAAASRALLDAPPGFRIALVHSAEMADHAASAGYALYLCGHTHGGQICLPGGRPVITRLRRCRFAAAGEWRVGRMIGYTSRGLGVGGVPLRYNCQGEMSIITLCRRGPEG